MRVKIGGDSRAQAPSAGEVMTMAKRTTELEQRCPSPPYTRWDQRVKPVLLCHLKRISGKSLCLSLETDDPEIAKRHMRLLVPMLIAKGRLSADAGAAKVYGPKKKWALASQEAGYRSPPAQSAVQGGVRIGGCGHSETVALSRRNYPLLGWTQAGIEREDICNASHARPRTR
jgi:hypothetical protein